VYSIQFYNGIVAFHLNHKYSQTPELVRNQPPAGASDFRYEGKNSARVNWPTLTVEKKILEVFGVNNTSLKLKKYLKSLLPTKIKQAIKKLVS
ncbi:MAG: hypothetical protein ACKVOY_10990, partial [Burkholderiaceae bacterium]